MSNYFIIALNLMSQFNLENVTVFSTKSEEVKPKSVCIIMIACTKIQIEKSYFDALFHPDVFTLYSMIFLMMSWRLKRGKWKISQGEGITNNEEENNMPSWFVSTIWNDLLMILSFDNFYKNDCRSTPVDYNLYRRFWALQDYFRKPTQCYDKIPWKAFQQVKCLYIYIVEFKTVSKCFVFYHWNLSFGFQCNELYNLLYIWYTQKLKMLQVLVTCLLVFMIDISFLECWCST